MTTTTPTPDDGGIRLGKCEKMPQCTIDWLRSIRVLRREHVERARIHPEDRRILMQHILALEGQPVDEIRQAEAEVQRRRVEVRSVVIGILFMAAFFILLWLAVFLTTGMPASARREKVGPEGVEQLREQQRHLTPPVRLTPTTQP